MNKPAESLPTQTTLARSADKAGSTPADTGAKRVRPATPEAVAKLLPGMLRLGADAALAEQRLRIAAQPKVRVVRGGHRGELGRIDGPALAGGYTVVTETGARLGLTERDFERLDVAALAAVKGA